MSNIHKNPTISFRPTPYERKEIEARIKASGLPKRIFYTMQMLNKENPESKLLVLIGKFAQKNRQPSRTAYMPIECNTTNDFISS